MSSPLIYIAGPYDKFRVWCGARDIYMDSSLVRYLGDSYEQFCAINIPRDGVAVVNLGDEFLGHALVCRMRGRNGRLVHDA